MTEKEFEQQNVFGKGGENGRMLDDAVRWELPDKERGYTVVGQL
mgnify:CR=1 FL=1